MSISIYKRLTTCFLSALMFHNSSLRPFIFWHTNSLKKTFETFDQIDDGYVDLEIYATIAENDEIQKYKWIYVDLKMYTTIAKNNEIQKHKWINVDLMEMCKLWRRRSDLVSSLHFPHFWASRLWIIFYRHTQFLGSINITLWLLSQILHFLHFFCFFTFLSLWFF